MSFSSLIFLFGFLPVLLALYYIPGNRFRNVLLVVSSLLFYALGQPEGVVLLLVSVIVNFATALCIEKWKNTRFAKIPFVFSFVFNLGLLWVFKYLDFSILQVNNVLHLGISSPKLLLPIGISFFSFKALSYCCDVYYGICPPRRNILDVMLYLSFFPQILSGPIQIYHDFEPQFTDRKFDADLFCDGIRLFIVGIAKKVILSNQIGAAVDYVFQDCYIGSSYSSLSVGFAWFGGFAYLLQLYFDFSGYSDMAIGIMNMFGFRCDRNFNYPYISSDVAEFWSRWHISLGTWFRQYVYNPIFKGLLSAKNPLTKKEISKNTGDFIALCVVWFFTGVWHGSGWKYLFWGIFYGIFVISEHKLEIYKKNRRKKLGLKKQPQKLWVRVIKHFYVIFVITIGQVIFRSDTLGSAFQYIKAMFGIGNVGGSPWEMVFMRDFMVLFVLSAVLTTPVIPFIKEKCSSRKVMASVFNVAECVVLLALFVVSMAYSVTTTYNPFIYFNF